MNIKDCRGEIIDPIRFREVCTPEKLAEQIEQRAKERGVPAVVRVDTIRSGGILMGSTCPCIVVSHPNPPQRYFDQLIIMNDHIVSFKFWGESKANTNHNKKAEARGSLKSLFINDDELALETEHAWHMELVDIYESLMN